MQCNTAHLQGASINVAIAVSKLSRYALKKMWVQLIGILSQRFKEKLTRSKSCQTSIPAHEFGLVITFERCPIPRSASTIEPPCVLYPCVIVVARIMHLPLPIWIMVRTYRDGGCSGTIVADFNQLRLTRLANCTAISATSCRSFLTAHSAHLATRLTTVNRALYREDAPCNIQDERETMAGSVYHSWRRIRRILFRELALVSASSVSVGTVGRETHKE